MDYKRIALYAALAVVSYLLLLQWNNDYPNGVQNTDDTSQAVSTTDFPAVLPDESADELPSVEPVPGSTPAEVLPASGELITVTTPVHHIRINPAGGDIVYAALPQYPVSLESQDEPFVLLYQGSQGTYISQSALLGTDGPDTGGRPTYSSEQTGYTLTSTDGTLSVPLTYTGEDGVTFTKTFVFSGNDYLIDVQYTINNTTDTPKQVNMIGQIRRDEAEDPSQRSGFGGVSTYLGAALTTNDDTYKKVDFGDMEDGTEDTVQGGWITFSQHYFISGWIPAADQNHRYQTRQAGNGDFMMSFANLEPTTVPANGTATVSAGFWAGPKDQNRLAEISPNLDLTIDYGMLFFIAKPIFLLLTTLDESIGNFGWSIIAMTIVIKLCLMYFSTLSYRSMAKMRKLTPHINALKERFGDDKQKLMQAQMELWRKEKVNPMGGCLPMLLQMPVLIGIYWVLNESVELRQAPWILWYTDLSAMDPFFILPLVMGASMYVSQMMTPMTTMDPMQAKMLKLMPLFFTVFFLWFPSGLVLYWLVSNVFNICHQTYINKRIEKTFKPKHV